MIGRPCAGLPLVAAAAFAHPAAAACDAANLYSFSFASQPAAVLAYESTYSYTASNAGGATRAFTTKITQNGMTSTLVAGYQMPQISTMVTGATTTANTLMIGGVFSGRTSTLSGVTRTAAATFTFAVPIRDFAVTLYDVDFAPDQFRDWVQISAGTNPYVPTLSTPWGNNNAGMPTATGSSLATGAYLGLTTASQAIGLSDSGNNSDQGTLYASFKEPVTRVTVRYGNAPLQSGETVTGQQAIGIGGISFCPMPVISMAKSSAPASSTLGAFNLPANDVIYTLTVANTGGSPVDASSIVLTDQLPANVTFRNAPFDGTTSLPIKLAEAGGTTLTAGNIAFSKLGDAGWTYTPASGYDGQVDAIRIVPGGQLGANASMSVQFVARIN